jgi:hypothetical protein
MWIAPISRLDFMQYARGGIKGMAMVLTRAEEELLNTAVEIAELTGTDLSVSAIEEMKPLLRRYHLGLLIHRMIVSEIIYRYTLVDMALADLIARYFFNVPRHKFDLRDLSRTKKFRIFHHHIMDEMFLLKKMQIVHAAKPIPGKIISSIHRLNSVRNAFAHSYHPESRREHRKLGKVLYLGKNIRTIKGLEGFMDDADDVTTYLGHRSHGNKIDIAVQRIISG